MTSAKLVQFIHPGHEHRPDAPGWKGWNTDDHRRKFLRAFGTYRTDEGADDDRGEMTFWGEWEAQSRVETLPPSVDGPRWVHSPVLHPLRSYRGAQNTDPFVFGERFLYTCCKQRLRSGRPTQLRSLPRGSVVLFGSYVGGGFGLDTAFVVDDHIDHHEPNDLVGHVPQPYVHTTIRPMYEMDAEYADPEGVGWRLYCGAQTNAGSGPFSFVPARPVMAAGPEGFGRPRITLDGLITPSLRQGQKITALSQNELRSVWRTVVDQVLIEDLVLATSFDMPPTERADDTVDDSRARC